MNEMKEVIEVPVNVIDAFLKIKRTGKVNMYSSNEVVNLMSEMGLSDAVFWLLDLTRDYPRVHTHKYIALMNAVSDVIEVSSILSEE